MRRDAKAQDRRFLVVRVRGLLAYASPTPNPPDPIPSRLAQYFVFYWKGGPDGDSTCYHRAAGSTARIATTTVISWDAPAVPLVLFEVRCFLAAFGSLLCCA